MLATLLDRYALLERFRADFLASHPSDEGKVEHVPHGAEFDARLEHGGSLLRRKVPVRVSDPTAR